MELGTVRALGTLTLFLAFVGLCLWAWAPAQRRRFDEAAGLPFIDEEGASEPRARRAPEAPRTPHSGRSDQ